MNEIFYKSLGEGAGVFVEQDSEDFIINEITLYGTSIHEVERLTGVSEEEAIKRALELSKNWT